MNASPDSEAIDVYLDGGVQFDGLRYGQGTDYSEIDADIHEFKITLNDSFTTFFDETRNLADDQEYTLFFFDLIESGTGVLVRDNNNRPDSGLVKLRIVHAAPGLDEVDLYITDRNEPLGSTTPTFVGVRFREIPEYVESIEGVYQIRATTPGTTNVVADSGPLGFEAGRILTVMLIDNEGGGGPFVFTVLVDS